MKRLLAISLLLGFAGCGPACGSGRAQSFNLQTGRERVTSLDGLWRFHTGDDPRWADPNFDDSHWALLRSDRSWTEQGYPNYSGYAWYRFTLQVPDGSKPADLLLTRIDTGYQVYANGKLIGSKGSIAPTRDPNSVSGPELFGLPFSGAGPQTLQIALRVWTFNGNIIFLPRGTVYPGNAAGDPFLLRNRYQGARNARGIVRVNQYASALLGAEVGLTILALFWLRPEDREYLWFAILLLADAAGAALGVARMSDSSRSILLSVLEAVTGTVSHIAMLVFLSIVLRLRRSFLWWVPCVALLLSFPFFALTYLQWVSITTFEIIWLVLALPADVWVIAALLICAFRKDTNARLLLAPIVLLYGCGALNNAWFLNQFAGWKLVSFSTDILLLSHPFPFRLISVISDIFILALLIFLVRRFSLARQEETRLATEMEAAHSMQSFLVPAKPPLTPGFQVESVYLPASEVGGDFFQILPDEDGSLLIVVGDVSGKGLKAAMTVSAIVGGLKQIATREPARVLTALNRQLVAEMAGGFVTCCAALIGSGHKLTIANAGHLSPYRNGEELAVETGLPLGLVAGNRYEETEHNFADGDRLTFISDGVVEAQNARKELFGFERTQQISTQPAAAIAETVKQFGQEDDITVVAITRR